MGQALYRTHRPRKLSEIVGQEHTTTALSHALKKGTISHAYLFTGPRGTGKTSIARILAHEINGLPYEDDAMHLDIIEIDAASNRRIEEIRDLRDKVHIAPTSAKYKVYIIDEVHMLTKEAFNALLKTLEEPPAHVIFILATTEAHKLPETIVSRTQRFAFKPVDLTKVTKHLRDIATSENIAITDDALQLVAEHGGGSFRDSISLLDQARNHEQEVTLDDVQRMLGIAPAKLVTQLIAALAAHDGIAVAEGLRSVQEQGYEPAQLARQLARQLRTSLLAGKSQLPNDVVLKLLARLIAIPASPDPRSALEISLLDVALSDQQVAGSNPAVPAKQEAAPTQSAVVAAAPTVSSPAHRPAAAKPKPVAPEPPKAEKPEPAPEPAHKKPVSGADGITLDPSIWPQVLNGIKGHHNTLYGIVRTTKPHFGPGELTLECGQTFYKRQLDQTKNRDIIAGVIEKLTGEVIFVQCVIGAGNEEPISATVSETPTPPSEPSPARNDALASVSNIFGGGELVES
jgi:DNA polymerase-3 subunit gamma/tau